MDITLPPLAEGADSGTVVSVLVAVGDRIEKDQTVIELENEKAIAPIPSTEEGVVSAIHVNEGDSITVGQKIVTLSDDGAVSAPKQKEKKSEPPKSENVPDADEGKSAPVAATAAAAASSDGMDYQYQSKSGYPPPASPSIRKLARDLGIDLTRVQGSQRGGRIVLEDLKRYIERLQAIVFGKEKQAESQPAAVAPSYAAPAPKPLDLSKWGPTARKPFSSLRKTISQRLTETWNTAPHVYQFDEVDISDLMDLRKKHKSAYAKKGANLTLTAFAVKAVCEALKKHPIFNSSLDLASNEIVQKDFYHIAIAVDTEVGLVVPVLREADRKSLLEIALELQELAEKARDRKLGADEMKGGCFTISNLGGIGGTHFTPIINAPDAAILGMGRGVTRPAYIDGKLQPRVLLPLCVSYDHRLIDGADGARFTTTLAQAFGNISDSDVKLSRSKTKG